MSPGLSSACGSFQKLFLLQFTMSTVSIENFQVSILPDCFLPCVPVFFKMCYTQYVFKFGKPGSGHRTGKGQSSSQFPRRAVLSNVQATGQLHSSPMPVRLRSKSSKLVFSITWTKNFQMFKLGLEKEEEPEIKLSTFAGS